MAGGEAEPVPGTLRWGSLISSLFAPALICYDRPSGRSKRIRDEIRNLSAPSDGGHQFRDDATVFFFQHHLFRVCLTI